MLSVTNENSNGHKNASNGHHDGRHTGESNNVQGKYKTPNPNNKNRSAKKRGSKFDATTIEIPQWLNFDIWSEYVTHRNELGKPLTRTACNRVIVKLEKLMQEGNDPTAVIEQTLENGWHGLFVIKGNGNGKFKSQADKAADNITAMYWEAADDETADQADNKIPRFKLIQNE